MAVIKVSLPDKDVTSIAPLTTPVTMRSVQKKTVHYIDYIGAELVRGRVCQGPSLWGPSLLGAEFVRGRVC